jgi:hypothetical protein
MIYPAIMPTIKTGDEELSYNGEPLDFHLIDFWRWPTSDIMSNTTRGVFAEFIVGTAIGLDKYNVRNDWDEYDLESSDGRIKIEVKSSAYIQVWSQDELSKISFSIRAPKSTNIRPSDVYVFCLLNHKNQATVDPLKMEQWEFYVVPTKHINEYKRSQTSITLNSLRKLAFSIQYTELHKAISNI